MENPAESPGSGQRPPESVRRAMGLLRVQATIWALVTAGIVADGSATLARTPDSKVTTTIVTVVLALAAGAFAAVKFRLAYRLPQGGHRTRAAVIQVETLMAWFAGLLLFALAVSVFGLILSPPVIIGGIMSARVARGLAEPPARQYFDAGEAAGAKARSLRPAGGGSLARFRACPQ
jgi:hypothetical protein